jgi:hypothetical protein
MSCFVPHTVSKASIKDANLFEKTADRQKICAIAWRKKNYNIKRA